LCVIAGVHASGYYAWKNRAPQRLKKHESDTALLAIIRTTCKKYLGKWGSRQVTMQVSTKELPVNHKRVARVMREHGLLAKRRCTNPYKNSPKTSDDIEIAENIVNRQYAHASLWPLRVFGTDITYVRIESRRWAYVSVIKDFCTGEIVAHATSLRPDTELVLKTLNIFATQVPLAARLGGILHSDRGSTYTSKAHCNRTRELGLLVSMSRKGNCIDNAPTESFFGHMKDELPHTGALTFEELCETIDEYILDHNTVRKQWLRNKMSPVDYREHLLGPSLHAPISVSCLH
jgi:transposase InsO family protein